MRTVLALILFLLSLPVSAQGLKPISALVDHPAEFKGKELPHAQYVAVELKGLTQSKVLWLNYDWLHEHEYYVPGQGLTPEFEKQILDALAFAVPNPKDDPSLFNDITQTSHSEGYGGEGIGMNHGSGRASSRGETQAKGVGITPMVGEGNPYDHAHGGASIEESIREAIWGEVNHRELPYGSNRVIAILDTGTYTHWTDGSREKRALIIREDPLRPGHLLSEHVPGSTASIQEELKPHLENFFNTLANPGEKLTLEQGVERYFERVPKQFAAAHAKRLFHAATNPNNFDIRAKWLDFGTETYLPSYQPSRVLWFKEPFGDSSQWFSQVIAPIKNSPLIPQSIRKKLTETRFNELYADAISKELLKLTGAPPELVEKIASNPKVSEFSRNLLQFTREEFSESFLEVDQEIPAELMHTQIGEILKRGVQEGSIENSLNDLSHVHEDLKKNLSQSYADFMTELRISSKAEGISDQALKHYMTSAAEIIHRETDSLLRPNLMKKGRQLVDQYQQNGDRSKIWNEIDTQIESGNRNPYTQNPYEIVIEKKSDHVAGTIRQKVFNLKTNQTRIETISMTPSVSREKHAECATLSRELSEIIP